MEQVFCQVRIQLENVGVFKPIAYIWLWPCILGEAGLHILPAGEGEQEVQLLSNVYNPPADPTDPDLAELE